MSATCMAAGDESPTVVMAEREAAWPSRRPPGVRAGIPVNALLPSEETPTKSATLDDIRILATFRILAT